MKEKKNPSLITPQHEETLTSERQHNARAAPCSRYQLLRLSGGEDYATMYYIMIHSHHACLSISRRLLWQLHISSELLWLRWCSVSPVLENFVRLPNNMFFRLVQCNITHSYLNSDMYWYNYNRMINDYVVNTANVCCLQSVEHAKTLLCMWSFALLWVSQKDIWCMLRLEC